MGLISGKFRKAVSTLLLAVMLSSELMSDYAYASYSNITVDSDENTDIILEDHSIEAVKDDSDKLDIATPANATKDIEDAMEDELNEEVAVLFNADRNDISIEGEEDENYIIEETYTYGVQNTGTRDGVLGTRLVLTLTDIDSSELELLADINMSGYKTISVAEESVDDDGNTVLVYYLDTCELMSTEKAGYLLKIITSAKHSYSVSGIFSARLLAGLDSVTSEDIFAIEDNTVSNTLHSDGKEDGDIKFEGKVTVRFRSNGGSSVPSQVLTKGEQAVRPNDPIRTGYDFIDWELNGINYDFGSDVVEDITLDAMWNPYKYEVVFDSDGGTGVYENQEVYYDNKINPVEDPVKEDYVFKGWYIDNYKWDFDTDVVRTVHAVDGVITLKAKYEKIVTYTVRFIDSSSSTTYAAYKVLKGGVLTEEVLPEKEGYIFLGWKNQDDDSDWDYDTEILKNTVLVAQWERILPEYKVTFDLNGGVSSGEIAVQTVKEGGTAVLPEIEPTLESKTFAGWYLGRVPYDFSQPVMKDITLTAKWNGTYTVTFNLDGGTVDGYSYDPITVNEGETIPEPTVKPTKEGFKFKGWYANERRYVFSEGVHSDLELLARWMETDAYEGRYAVSIYGIYADKDASGNTLGLTFGPALSYNKVDFVSHIPEEEDAMCIHDMSWKDIIEQSKVDATVFQECLEHGCTKSVEFELTGDLSEPYQKVNYKNASDGDGYIGLKTNYNKYTINNKIYENAYAASSIRTMLVGRNGYTSSTETYAPDEENSLVHMLPGELGDHVISRQFDYYTNTNFNTTSKIIDKLWLFALGEFHNVKFYSPSNYNGRYYFYGEGTTYEKLLRYAKTSYDIRNNVRLLNTSVLSGTATGLGSTWLRTPYRNMSNGSYSTSVSSSTYSNISPGFCLEGPGDDNLKFRLQFNVNSDATDIRGVEQLEDIKVPVNAKVGDVVDELPMLYRDNGYKLMGWYTAQPNKLPFWNTLVTSEFSHDYEVTLDTTVTHLLNCYARWGRPGYLESAYALNRAINSSAIGFKKSETLTNQYAITDISQMKDETLYTWYDTSDRIQYWWSSTGKMIVEDTTRDMFYNKDYLITIDLTDIDFSNVTTMYEMFDSNDRLQNIIFGSDINTSKVTNMGRMFYNCPMLSNANLENINTSNVVAMQEMFYKAAFTDLDLSNFDTRNVRNMSSMFSNCTKLTNIVYGEDFVYDQLTNLDMIYSSNTAWCMYYGCPANKPSNWETGRWVDFNTAITGAGSYIDGHKVILEYHYAAINNTPDLVLPSNYEVLWGYSIGEDAIPTMVDSSGVYSFIAWNEQNEKYNTANLSADRKFTYTDSSSSSAYYGYSHRLSSDRKSTTVKIYMRWGMPGLAKSGSYINSSIYSSSSILSFERTTEAPLGTERGLTDISYCDDRSVMTWYDTTLKKQYWWSSTNNMTLYDSAYNMFSGKSYLQTIDLSNINFSRCLSMERMFNGCSRLKNIIINEQLDTSKVTSMKNMFYGCSALTDISLGKFDTSSVTSMEMMFCNCSYLVNVNFDGIDVSQVTTMYEMFYGCSNLVTVVFGDIDTSNVTTMYEMFKNCGKLSNIDTINLDTPNVVTMYEMFYNCASLKSLDLSSWDTQKVKTVSYMFSDCTNLTDIVYGKNFVQSSLTNLAYMNSNNTTYNMFKLCPANKPPLWEHGRWTLINDPNYPGTYIDGHIVNIRYYGAYSPNISGLTLPSSKQVLWGYPIGEEAVPEMEDPTNSYYFDGWNEQDRGYDLNRRVTKDTVFAYTSSYSYYNMYHSIGSTSSTVYLYTKWMSEGVSKIGSAINSAITGSPTVFKQSTTAPTGTEKNLRDISICDDKSVMTWLDGTTQYWWSSTGTMIIPGDASNMFSSETTFVSIDLTNVIFDRVTNMQRMFYNCDSLTTVKFDDNIDTSRVVNMRQLFDECTNLKVVNIQDLDTDSVTDMSYMFSNCSNINNLDLSNWNTSNLVTAYEMFYNCYALSDINVGDWNTEKLVNISYMFSGCTSLTELNLNNWNTQKVTNMSYMFSGCTNLSNIIYGENFVATGLTDLNYMNSYNTTYYMFRTCPANKPPLWEHGRWTLINDPNYPGTYIDGHIVNIRYYAAYTPTIQGLVLPSSKQVLWGYPIGEEAVPEISDPNNTYMFDGWNEQDRGYDLNRNVTKDTIFAYTSSYNYYNMYHSVGSTSSTVYLYPKWKSEGVSKIGSLINSAITGSPTVFKKSPTAPTGTEKYLSDISICDDKSVMTWIDGNIQYWWSSTGTMIIPGDASNMFSSESYLVSVDLTDVIFDRVTNMQSMFYNCRNLTTVKFDDNINTNKVTNMRQLFDGCNKLTTVNLEVLDTGSVNYMNYMFSECNALKTVNISNWDTTSLLSTSYMFEECTNLETINLNAWNTMNLQYIDNMFVNCSALTNINVSNWNTANIVNMSNLFNGCVSLTSLNLLNWNTSKVTSMQYMFSRCNNLKTINFGDKFVQDSLVNLNYLSDSRNGTYGMYNLCTANKPFKWEHGRWTLINDTSCPGTYIDGHIVNVYYYNAETPRLSGVVLPSVKQVLWGYPLGEELTPVVSCTDIGYTFDGWNEQSKDFGLNRRITKDSTFVYTSYYSSYNMYHSINSTSSSWYLYTKWINPGLTDTGSVINSAINSSATSFVQSTTKPADSLNPIDISLCDDRSVLTWYQNGVQYWWSSTGKMRLNPNAAGMFSGKSKLTSINLTNVDFTLSTTTYNMFNSCSSLKTIIFDNNTNTSNVTTMGYMFAGCNALTNVNLNVLDTESVTVMAYMFSGCSSLQSIDLSNFNTSNVTTMVSMFYQCSTLKNLNLSSFDTSSVISMTSMFAGCSSLQSLNLSNFNTSSVTVMASMFNGCTELTTLNISNFDTSKVTNFMYMFQNCSKLSNVSYGTKFSAEHLTNLMYFDTSNMTYYMYNNCNARPSHWTSGRWDLPNGTYINNLYYTVTYYKNYSKVQGIEDSFTKKVKWGYLLSEDELPVLNNTDGIYVFDGWYRIPNGYKDTKALVANSEDTKITANITLYARWRHEDWTDTGNVTNGRLKTYFGTGYTQFKQSNVIPSGVETYDISECEDGSILVYGLGDTIYWWGKHGKMIMPSANRLFSAMSTLTIVSLNNIDLTNAKTISAMFSECINLTSVDFGNVDTSKIEDMSSMFDRCYALRNIDVSKLNTTSTTNMSRMFGDCRNLQSIDISSFNTSNVLEMRGMFSGCSSLTTLDLHTFNTSNVITLQEIFDNCTNLTTLNISSFDTRKVKNFQHMFFGDSKLTAINYGNNFVPDAGTNFTEMFKGCSAQTPKPPASIWNAGWDPNGTYLE